MLLFPVSSKSYWLLCDITKNTVGGLGLERVSQIVNDQMRFCEQFGRDRVSQQMPNDD